jgi:hypothetical protein
MGLPEGLRYAALPVLLVVLAGCGGAITTPPAPDPLDEVDDPGSVVAVFARTPGGHPRYLLFRNGTFLLRYSTRPFPVDFTGSYVIADATITFDFRFVWAGCGNVCTIGVDNSRNTAELKEGRAVGSIRGDSLLVEYDWRLTEVLGDSWSDFTILNHSAAVYMLRSGSVPAPEG